MVDPTAVLEAINRRALRPAVLTMTLRARAPATVTLRYPTGVVQTLAVSPRGIRLRRTLQLRPGASRIRFRAVARAGRAGEDTDPGLWVEDPVLLEPGFLPFLSKPGRG